MEGLNFYQNYDWGEELTNTMKVWLLVVASLCYCYVTSKFVAKGNIRLCLFTPIVCLFLILPLHIKSTHIGGISAFFIAWLANFKTLLFAFGKGPLSDPSLSFSHFIAIGCFPIKIQMKITKIPPRTPAWRYWVKSAMIPVFLKVYEYRDLIHPKIIMIIYGLHIYFSLEIVLAAVAALSRLTLGLELEPQFNEPYRSTSLQDFWGRRWNLMVTRILRTSVYEPTIQIWNRVLGREQAQLSAVLSTFLVSALMHELMFYYVGRTWPTWEITWFFILHGVSLSVEILIKKKASDRWRLPEVVSSTLTIGYVIGTGFWLFFPQLLRCQAHVKAFEEYAVLLEYSKKLLSGGAV